ncbi:MAG TPA: GNAT family N-acetyltransferase [Actinophytocola sp.]|nr:GNAT family N-acetyltransferase [Actinophytocola sp.]
MTVREARPGELDEVRDLLHTAYVQYAGVAHPELYGHYLAELTNVERSAGLATTLVAVDDGRIVGTARLYPPGAAVGDEGLPAGWAWVRAVAVRPELRRAGIARRLMADCTRRATDIGATVLCLHTMAFMVDAIRLYERLGYRRVPELDIDVAAFYGVGEMIALAYRLDLTP